MAFPVMVRKVLLVDVASPGVALMPFKSLYDNSTVSTKPTKLGLPPVSV